MTGGQDRQDGADPRPVTLPAQPSAVPMARVIFSSWVRLKVSYVTAANVNASTGTPIIATISSERPLARTIPRRASLNETAHERSQALTTWRPAAATALRRRPRCRR